MKIFIVTRGLTDKSPNELSDFFASQRGPSIDDELKNTQCIVGLTPLEIIIYSFFHSFVYVLKVRCVNFNQFLLVPLNWFSKFNLLS